jgi:RNA polymerase-binding protein DksA
MAGKKQATAKKQKRKPTAGKVSRGPSGGRQGAAKATRATKAAARQRPEGNRPTAAERQVPQGSSFARTQGGAPAGSVLLRPPRVDLPSPTPPRPAPRSPVGAPAAAQAQPVTPADYPEFRQLLLAERERLLQELATLGERLQQVEEIGLVEAANEDDYGDVASEAFEREKGFALETSVQGMLRMVEDALRKLDEGTYGVCERCGSPIGLERLRALPFANLCIRCKAEQERESGSGNGWSG